MGVAKMVLTAGINVCLGRWVNLGVDVCGWCANV